MSRSRLLCPPRSPTSSPGACRRRPHLAPLSRAVLVVAEGLGPGRWPLRRPVAGRRSDGPSHVGALRNTDEHLFWLAGAALAGVAVVGMNPTLRGGELPADIDRTAPSVPSPTRPCSTCWRASTLGSDPTGRRTNDPPTTGRRSTASTPPDGRRPTAGARSLYLRIFTSGSTGGPKAVRTPRAGRPAPGRASASSWTMRPPTGHAPPSRQRPAVAARSPVAWGATLSCAAAVLASSFLPEGRANGATFLHTVGRPISNIQATPPNEHDRDHRLRLVLGPETSAGQGGVPPPLRGAAGRGVRVERDGIVLRPVPAGGRVSLAKARDRDDDAAAIDPQTLRNGPGADPGRRGPLTNPADAIAELVGAAPGRTSRATTTTRGRRRAHPHGGHWSGDLAYRDAEGIFYFAGRTNDWLRVDSENFAAAPVERILSRFPVWSGWPSTPPPTAVPATRRWRRWSSSWAGSSTRWPSPPFWPTRPTWAPSGRPGTRGSSTPCP